MGWPKFFLTRHLSKSAGISEDLFELSLREDFERETNKLRLKWREYADTHIPLSAANLMGTDISNGGDSDYDFVKILENKNFSNDIDDLMESLKIPKALRDLIEKYVVFEDMPSIVRGEKSEDTEGLKMIEDLSDPTEDIILKVGRETRFEDLEMAWEIMRKKNKVSTTKHKPKKNLWRDYQIYKGVKNGATIPQINKELKKEFGKIGDLDYGNIKKIHCDFCNKLKIPHKNRPKLNIK